MLLSQGKVFEKPDAGQFLGTIIDVVDLANKATSYGPKDKVRIFYVLGTGDGKYALDSEGNPFRVMREFNASISESSKLYEFLGMVLQSTPPLLNSTEELAQLLIGRSNFLFLTKVPNPKKSGDYFINIAGLGPVPAGQLPPPIPKDYVRVKDRQAKTGFGQPQQRPAFVPQQAPAAQVPPANAQPAGTPALPPGVRSF